jgi:hypothetical protein
VSPTAPKKILDGASRDARVQGVQGTPYSFHATSVWIGSIRGKKLFHSSSFAFWHLCVSS